MIDQCDPTHPRAPLTPDDDYFDRLVAAAAVKTLVDRFLAWPLPKSVCSDGCVTDANYKFPRSGTNLLTADEARQMIEYLLAPTAAELENSARCGETKGRECCR